MPLGTEVSLSPWDFVLDGDHVCYSYCDFVETSHSRYWLVQVQVVVFYAFYFLKNRRCLLDFIWNRALLSARAL